MYYNFLYSTVKWAICNQHKVIIMCPSKQDDSKSADKREEKIKQLKKICEDYRAHLVKSGLPDGKSSKLDIKVGGEKFDIVNALIAILDNEELDTDAKLERFKTRFNYSDTQKTLSKSRDFMDDSFKKIIVTVLTLGLAALFGIFKVEGATVSDKIKKSLNELKVSTDESPSSHKPE